MASSVFMVSLRKALYNLKRKEGRISVNQCTIFNSYAKVLEYVHYQKYQALVDRVRVKIWNIIYTQMVLTQDDAVHLSCNKGCVTDPATHPELMWTVYISLVDTFDSHTLRGPYGPLYKSKFETVISLRLRKPYFIQ